MKIEKLTDKKIKIICSTEDMNSNNISVQNFFDENAIPQKMLQFLLSQAEKEVGFKSDDCKLLVEAISNEKDEFIFTITKLYKYDIPNIYNNLVFKFDNFENFSDFLIHLKNINNIDLENFSKYCSLYLYKNTYYLYIAGNFNILSNAILHSLVDFSSCITCTPKLDGILHEYGKIIFTKNSFYNYIKKIQ